MEMVKKGRELRVRIAENRNDRSLEGVIQVQSWDKKERILRALKFGGLCWAAALVAVFIPLLHFILVPGFLLGGPILAYLIAGQESRVLGGEGTCPFCLAPLIIAPAALRFPLSDICNKCHNSLNIQPWDDF